VLILYARDQKQSNASLIARLPSSTSATHQDAIGTFAANFDF